MVGFSTAGAHHWRRDYDLFYPQQVPVIRPQRQTFYPPQKNYQSTVKLPPGVSVNDAQWVCTSPKTGDMVSKTHFGLIFMVMELAAWLKIFKTKKFIPIFDFFKRFINFFNPNQF